ncbi:non-specific lipid transfer protein GPI-anchored 12-like [Andrographis paniculata]|uniref:non-specific lipid transfer protein GPI-anchored 12-like n=1 Tax=Andrographis paniculata TaxID=175694 RepID=UPI0021E8AC0D|nr:non-specific lipid transfer protein GPI-anchored 12-like [Andrographis paniculata]
MIKPRTTITTTITIAYLLITVMAASPPAGEPSPSSAPAPSPETDCMSVLINMADCLSYVEADSNLTKPDPLCCHEVSDLISTQPVCLCKFLANSSQFGLSDIDTNKALKLSTLCNISASAQLCSVIGVPVPGLAPSPSPAISPSSSTGNETNGSPTSNLPSSSKLIGLSIVMFTSLLC